VNPQPQRLVPGVDRAALDTAREPGIPCGGWCPRSRKAAHHGLPEAVHLRSSSLAFVRLLGPHLTGTQFTATPNWRRGAWAAASINGGIMKKVFILLALLALPSSATAQELKQEQVEDLKAYLMGVRAIDRLQRDGLLNQQQADHYRQEHLQLASVAAGQPVPTVEALDELVRKNDTSRFWGFLTFVNIVWVFAAILLAIAIIWLCVIYIGPILKQMPVGFWEVAAYVFVIAGLFSGAFWPVLDIWFVVPACLLLIGALAFTKFLHFQPRYEDRGHDVQGGTPGKGWVQFTYSQFVALVCTIAWSAAAIYYQSHLLGFMSVMMLEALLGFSVIVMPGCVGMGFEEEDNIPRATTASFVILVVYVITLLLGGFNPHTVVENGITKEVVSPLIYFKTGAIFMGAFVYYLGLLILASRYYNAKKGNYILLQIITIVSGVLAFYIGATFEINALLGIGGTFFVLYLLEKYTELPWKQIGWAWGLLGLAGLLYAAVWFAGNHPEYFLLGLR
jgi:hypothetical protein